MQPLVHPGSLLLGEMLERDWSLTELAKQTHADRELLRDFLLENADLTPELADQLAAGTGIEVAFWTRMQQSFDSKEHVEFEPSQAADALPTV